MTWRFHFPLRNYDFNRLLVVGLTSNNLNTSRVWEVAILFV